MMLRSLVDEVVRRRLWPIPLVALLIAIAAPVLFMKSAPADAPAATQAPPAAEPGKLPPPAEVLVTASDKAVTARQTSKPKAQDPFAAPASAKTKSDSASAAAAAPQQSSAPQQTSTPKSIPLVITNSNGDKLTVTPAKTKKKPAAKKQTPKPATPQPATPAVAVSKPVTYVDVRFGKALPSKVRRRVPRMQTFRAGGKVAAIFVKYSPSRDKAVFAVAPSTKVSGDAKCRRKAGVCRYVDLAEGQHVRLSMRTSDGSVVSRRLDVVRVHRAPAPIAAATAPAATPLSTPLSEATCLLKRLLSLSPILPSISVDACE
jgi:hypothetical protein